MPAPIHKKEGRLHIYVRQDKYKGVLKSHNWVGRTSLDGKQIIYSSGTRSEKEAIPILEAWFDKLQEESARNKELKAQEARELELKAQEARELELKAQEARELELKAQEARELELKAQEAKELALQATKVSGHSAPLTQSSSEQNQVKHGEVNKKGLTLEMLGKLKGLNFSKFLGKKDKTSQKGDTKIDFKNLKKTFETFFNSRVSKLSISSEEITGLDITREAIRVAQATKGKDEKWILDKFSYRLLDQEKIGDDLTQNKDYLAEEISLALSNAKITTKNVALSIPVTSAIIKVVESPLMTDEELQQAIETDSLWENLIQLTDKLIDYSIFHQIINRNSKKNTMDILFVASKLSDVNAYSSVAKKAGLNPVIMDVRCFTLKNAYDNTQFKVPADKLSSAILELGVEDNYLMIVHQSAPVIADIFLRSEEKINLAKVLDQKIENETENVVRRYSMQIKQAVQDYESKYENKINSIQVISSFKNIDGLISLFKKNIPGMDFVKFNPLEGVSIPAYNSEKINNDNTSQLSSVLGLAYRKLDVFGYYKFVTAVKNINLLPNRDSVRQQNKIKFLSGFAFKGLAGSVAGIYLLLIVFSFFQISSNKKKLLEFDQVQKEFNIVNSGYSKLIKQRKEMTQALSLGKLVNSNQMRSYRAMAQITRSVPSRVQFSKMTFDGSNSFIIEGMAFSDQDILSFISNLNAKSLVEQASLAAMKVSTGEQSTSGNNKKGFTILCKLKVA
ncbi:pilus assembly protein PilM [Pelagibacteraceae bacterium]|nr:pilus assembly protein PilM [Pelagibacteraceae bacterium]